MQDLKRRTLKKINDKRTKAERALLQINVYHKSSNHGSDVFRVDAIECDGNAMDTIEVLKVEIYASIKGVFKVCMDVQGCGKGHMLVHSCDQSYTQYPLRPEAVEEGASRYVTWIEGAKGDLVVYCCVVVGEEVWCLGRGEGCIGVCVGMEKRRRVEIKYAEDDLVKGGTSGKDQCGEVYKSMVGVLNGLGGARKDGMYAFAQFGVRVEITRVFPGYTYELMYCDERACDVFLAVLGGKLGMHGVGIGSIEKSEVSFDNGVGVWSGEWMCVEGRDECTRREAEWCEKSQKEKGRIKVEREIRGRITMLQELEEILK